ncbi:hypothetical protein [Saccharibacillus kuerlensis]|uniref:DUF4352 domain-containing protein n=1 Tax=Saccharibacillus kuerlensis TaxID=459527 RepID=A0ABQ2L471_9BACL|nr:hypothetical protein [Saccharibacillus kuerlensis]GGO02197.1 hypothetical protein GCM10010969_25280 [Saccharibacillus kuerlensis]
MNKKQGFAVSMLLIAALVLAACGGQQIEETQAENGAAASQEQAPLGGVDDDKTQAESAEPAENEPTAAENSEILVVIDQTEKPIEGSSFDFSVRKLPEGYSLQEMQWNSDKNQISTALLEAVQNGQTGEEGFYISGDGQFSGFIYPDSMQGEQGEIVLVFGNEAGEELTWKKEITL